MCYTCMSSYIAYKPRHCIFQLSTDYAVLGGFLAGGKLHFGSVWFLLFLAIQIVGNNENVALALKKSIISLLQQL